MKKYIHILEKLGFSELAAKIYITLLDTGATGISQLSEQSGLQRVQIYRNLPYLIERDFVFVTQKGKRKLYSPASPDLLKDEYERLQSQTFHVLDELGEKYKNLENRTNITFGTGRKAIGNCYYDLLASLPRGGEFLRITSELDSEKIKKDYQPKDYIYERDKKGIERSLILSEKSYKQKVRKLERDEKVVSSKDILLDDNIMFTIYGDKISLIDFNKETAIIIESAEMARFQEKAFKLLFKKL